MMKFYQRRSGTLIDMLVGARLTFPRFSAIFRDRLPRAQTKRGRLTNQARVIDQGGHDG
jgi:hypothetical protein